MRSVQKNLYLLIILLISFPLNVLAQNKTITGTVRDANDVVIGASVTVKGQSSVGTITDIGWKLHTVCSGIGERTDFLLYWLRDTNCSNKGTYTD